MNEHSKTYDVFVSHASEDKDSFVRPLAVSLRSLGASVWYDEFSLRLGDSLSRSIDRGLTNSSFGLVIISQSFIDKPWPDYELRGLVTRDVEEGRVILPVWHGVSKEEVRKFSPSLSDKVALNTENLTAEEVSIKILREIRPDLYAKHPRAELERIASGEALNQLQQEIERTQEELELTQEELAEFKCPYCGAPIVARVHAPADSLQKHWDMRDEFECGHTSFGGYTERPCPSAPDFPSFSDFKLHFHESPEEKHWKWQCYAIGQTEMARSLHLTPGYGETQEEAEQKVREAYERSALKWDA